MNLPRLRIHRWSQNVISHTSGLKSYQADKLGMCDSNPIRWYFLLRTTYYFKVDRRAGSCLPRSHSWVVTDSISIDLQRFALFPRRLRNERKANPFFFYCRPLPVMIPSIFYRRRRLLKPFRTIFSFAVCHMREMHAIQRLTGRSNDCGLCGVTEFGEMRVTREKEKLEGRLTIMRGPHLVRCREKTATGNGK